MDFDSSQVRSGPCTAQVPDDRKKYEEDSHHVEPKEFCTHHDAALFACHQFWTRVQ
jgi:hypothetical protein